MMPMYQTLLFLAFLTKNWVKQSMLHSRGIFPGFSIENLCDVHGSNAKLLLLCPYGEYHIVHCTILAWCNLRLRCAWREDRGEDNLAWKAVYSIVNYRLSNCALPTSCNSVLLYMCVRHEPCLKFPCQFYPLGCKRAIFREMYPCRTSCWYLYPLYILFRYQPSTKFDVPLLESAVASLTNYKCFIEGIWTYGCALW